ncbi:MAG: hypothetical protein WKG00_21470 [Polyangiaceae bacterium]
MPWLRTSLLAATLVASGATAPFQCAGDPDPDQAHEEEPAEALYGLANQFQQRGDKPAQLETLRYIVARYPKSRFAVMARDDLEKTSAK